LGLNAISQSTRDRLKINSLINNGKRGNPSFYNAAITCAAIYLYAKNRENQLLFKRPHINLSHSNNQLFLIGINYHNTIPIKSDPKLKEAQKYAQAAPPASLSYHKSEYEPKKTHENKS